MFSLALILITQWHTLDLVLVFFTPCCHDETHGRSISQSVSTSQWAVNMSLFISPVSFSQELCLTTSLETSLCAAWLHHTWATSRLQTSVLFGLLHLRGQAVSTSCRYICSTYENMITLEIMKCSDLLALGPYVWVRESVLQSVDFNKK